MFCLVFLPSGRNCSGGRAQHLAQFHQPDIRPSESTDPQAGSRTVIWLKLFAPESFRRYQRIIGAIEGKSLTNFVFQRSRLRSISAFVLSSLYEIGICFGAAS